MSVTIYSPENRSTINWASGTSTEIFIYPADGSFQERNFLFRISTATVAAEESTFTFFEGITRHLMILKGELELIHEGRYTKHLNPYDKDTFSGEWQTRSKGRVTDFNLMLKGHARGTLRPHHLSGSGQTFSAESDFSFVYVAAGTCGGAGLTFHTGDLVRFTTPLQISGEASVIEISVWLRDTTS